MFMSVPSSLPSVFMHLLAVRAWHTTLSLAPSVPFLLWGPATVANSVGVTSLPLRVAHWLAARHLEVSLHYWLASVSLEASFLSPVANTLRASVFMLQAHLPVGMHFCCFSQLFLPEARAAVAA